MLACVAIMMSVMMSVMMSAQSDTLLYERVSGSRILNGLGSSFPYYCVTDVKVLRTPSRGQRGL